jgi:hypothetical protein
MIRVLRYKVHIDDRPSEIGRGKVLLAIPRVDVGETRAHIDVWVEVPLPARWPQFPEETRRVKTVSTGQPINDSLDHLISCAVGKEIVHIYEWL